MLATPEGWCSRLFVLWRDTSMVSVEIAVIGRRGQDPSLTGYSYAMDEAATEIERRIAG
jgi:hypothetical protein